MASETPEKPDINSEVKPDKYDVPDTEELEVPDEIQEVKPDKYSPPSLEDRRTEFFDNSVTMFQGVNKQKIETNVKISKNQIILSNGINNKINLKDVSNLIYRSGKKPKLTIKLKDGSGITLYPHKDEIDDSNILKDLIRESLKNSSSE